MVSRIALLEQQLKEEKTRADTIKEACQKYLDEEVVIKEDLKNTKQALAMEKYDRACDVE